MDHQHWQARKLSRGECWRWVFPECGDTFSVGGILRMFWLENGWKVVDSILKCHIFDTWFRWKIWAPFSYNFQNWSQRQRFLLQARREDEQIYKLKGFPIGDFILKMILATIEGNQSSTMWKIFQLPKWLPTISPFGTSVYTNSDPQDISWNSKMSFW